MKIVKAIIKPERFEFVKKALEEKGYSGMTITKVRGRGEQKGIALEYRGGLMMVDLLPKIQIEAVIQDQKVEEFIALSMETARTGKIGDGRIFVLPVERSIRIHIGEIEF